MLGSEIGTRQPEPLKLAVFIFFSFENRPINLYCNGNLHSITFLLRFSYAQFEQLFLKEKSGGGEGHGALLKA